MLKSSKETNPSEEHYIKVQSETLLSLRKFQDYEFDYEIGVCKVEDNNLLMPTVDRNSIAYQKLDLDKISDNLKIEVQDGKNCITKKLINKANCVKRLVSKKKRRLENEEFDLDLAYISKRVIAMGYPSTGCESLIRNSLNDTKSFFSKYHPEGVKVYNLCLEKGRIYDKKLFNEIPSNNMPCRFYGKKNYPCALFPFKDHNPPPIKLILEFCIDISIFLTRNPKAVAAIHCKAGKGRSGLMIVCYLIFAELCQTSDEALKHYSRMRTHNNKGVTIPSQIRFIKYFEAFLHLNYNKPFVKMIPKMITTQFINSLNSNNMIKNFLNDSSYFYSSNQFNVWELRAGPFENPANLQISIYNNEMQQIPFKFEQLIQEDELGKKNVYYFNILFNTKYPFNSDIKIEVKGIYKFYFWINLWYSTLNVVANTIQLYEIFPQEESSGKDNFKVNTAVLKSLYNKSQDDYSSNMIKLADFLDHLNSYSDLNQLISLTNNCLLERKLPIINRKSLIIELNAFELDKFAKAKDMLPEFKTKLRFGIGSEISSNNNVLSNNDSLL